MPKTPAKKYQPSPKVLACRENGRKGGLARAKKNSAAKRKEWSSKGGKKCAELYAGDFFAFLTTKRKHVGRYRKEVVKNKVAPPIQKKKKLA